MNICNINSNTMEKGCSKKSLLDPFGQMGRQPMPEKGSIGIAYAAYAAPAPLGLN